MTENSRPSRRTLLRRGGAAALGAGVGVALGAGGPALAASGAFTALAPTRVYDSRRPVPQPGPITKGQTRDVYVGDGRDLETGEPNLVDLVPAGATAVTFIITAQLSRSTEGFSPYFFPAFLTVNPGGVTTVSGATLSWRSNDRITVGSVCPLDDQRRLTVVCGGGEANELVLVDLILDITGYYL